MAVYVDNAFIRYGNMKMSHMIADNLLELHRMANRLDMKEHWFQNGRIPHYDICKSKRAQAIELGAIPVSTRELIKIARKNNETHILSR